MTDEHNEHFELAGPEFEKARPVFDAIFTKRQELANAMAHAVRRAIMPKPGTTWQPGDLLAYHAADRIPPNAVECIEFCPETMKGVPTLLRDMADMYEDLAKQVSIEPHKAWEPNSK